MSTTIANTVNNSSPINMVSGNFIASNSHLNIRKIQFINGIELDKLKTKAYAALAKDPLVSYSYILDTIETRLYTRQPENLLRSNVQKYMKEQNLLLLEVNNSYKFRPDIISHIFYGTNEYFHLVLMANNMKSFLEFVPENSNNLVFIFKPSIINLI